MLSDKTREKEKQFTSPRPSPLPPALSHISHITPLLLQRTRLTNWHHPVMRADEMAESTGSSRKAYPTSSPCRRLRR